MDELVREKTPEEIKKEVAEAKAARRKEMDLMENETRYFKVKADYYEEYLRMWNAQNEFMMLQRDLKAAMEAKQNIPNDGEGSTSEPQSE